MTHTCIPTHAMSYDIRQAPNGIWGIWDRIAHTCVLYVSYCPFCGEKL